MSKNKTQLSPEKQKMLEKKTQLLELTDVFCQKYLDDDYKELCQKMIRKMSRKQNVPFLSGRLEIWAASIIQALGQVNFLFDKSFEPYVTHDAIHKFFGTTKSTVTNKSRDIRKMLELDYFNNKFATKHLLETSPLHNLVAVNGRLVTTDMLPPELQELVQQMGITEFYTIEFDNES